MPSTDDAAWLEADGAGGASNGEHKKVCTRKFCTRCFWIVNHVGLKAKVGEWVDYKWDLALSQSGIGCSFCALAKDDPGMVRLGLFKANNLGFANYGMRQTRKHPSAFAGCSNIRPALGMQLAWRSWRIAMMMYVLAVHLLMSSGPESLLIPSQETPPA